MIIFYLKSLFKNDLLSQFLTHFNASILFDAAHKADQALVFLFLELFGIFVSGAARLLV